MSTTVTQPRQPTLPEGYPFTALYEKRVRQDRDLTILISDFNLERGSGKTTLALRLCEAMDRTDEGMTLDKCTLSPERLSDAYTGQPEGSALLLDEAEGGLSNRRSMSKVNEALRQLVAMGRVEQKYTVLTTPGGHMIDKDVRAMCDIWILVHELGVGSVYKMDYNPFGKGGGNALTKYLDEVRWSKRLPGDLQHIYRELTTEKRKQMRGEGDDGGGYVPAEKVDEAREKAWQEAERQTRDDLIRSIYESNPNMTQKKVADAVGLTRSRVADILAEGDQ